MKPLKLTVPGRYYDVWIYAGRLYLWGLDCSIRVLDWDRLIDAIGVEERLSLALECGFKRGDYLYGSRWDRLFRDAEIKAALVGKFESLSDIPLELSERDLGRAEIGHQDNPFPFPHSDGVIYNRELHICGPRGVFSASCSKRNRRPVSPDVLQVWDCPTVGISAGYGSLALSAGNEGLFELALGRYDWSSVPEEPRRLSHLHSSSCRWVFYSIFSSSNLDSGYLADFTRNKDRYGRSPDWASTVAEVSEAPPASFLSSPAPEEPERRLRGILAAQDLFEQTSFSWGGREKLCQASAGRIEIIRYTPWKQRLEERFERLGGVEVSYDAADLVSADSAVFGFVLELQDGLVVLDSRLTERRIPGEPVNWRVFPRSRQYENHLHVIFDDRLEVYSFNDDYFVDQRAKRVGLEVRAGWGAQGRSVA